jgi:hypothetical protein
MIFYLNRGLILEQEIVKALKAYFAACDVDDYYKNFSINVTNQHPFARLMLDLAKGGNPNMSLFPAIIVATESEYEPPGLEGMLNGDQSVTLEPSAIPLLKDRYSMMTDKKLALIESEMEKNGGKLYGFATGIRRHDEISIEIWAENVQLKNELYELTRLFIGGGLEAYFSRLFEDYTLGIFDHTLRGQRSNNFNVDFGVTLAGAHLIFGVDYILEQTIIDTELVDGNIDMMEVINHVREYAETARSAVFDYSAGGSDGGGGAAGNGGGGNGEGLAE